MVDVLSCMWDNIDILPLGSENIYDIYLYHIINLQKMLELEQNAMETIPIIEKFLNSTKDLHPFIKFCIMKELLIIKENFKRGK